ncbi:integrator complex subunit 12 [Zeugodacus cucurbitae]|uniref:integrator complex subunit 12 n=1 Tax=Zeugodacus cucurbitae TaxID=28588 RepID=UPI0023D9088A|nr:integrator complex subunit 12 [Zeugodacus cucurbitae]
MTANTNEMEMLRKAIRLLHSPHSNSAVELRLMLDEAIKQRYGPEHMISNNMSKGLMELEANFPGRAATPPPPPEHPTAMDQDPVDEVINLTGSPAKTISDSPDTIIDSDDGANMGGGMLGAGDEDVNLKEFGDLNCAVCGEMVFTATNRLIECSNCGTLYHQECHKPPITDEEASEGQEHNWQCDNCLNKPSTSKAAGVVIEEPISLISKTKSSATSSRSSSTSNSSSPFAILQQEVSSTTTSTVPPVQVPSMPTSRHHHHKSSRSHKEERPSSGSSKAITSSSNINPTFNVVSASEKSTSHTSKKSSSHSSSSSKSSSSKSSKHHDSNKRKAK